MAEKSNGKDTDKLVHELVERVEKLEKENQRLKKHITANDTNTSGSKRFSRRDFLKKLGAGAIGLGALGLTPAASWYKLGDSGVTQDGEQVYLPLDGSEPLTGNINFDNHQLNNVFHLQLSDRDNDGTQWEIFDAPSQNGELHIGTPDPKLSINNNGNVDISNGQLNEQGNRVATRTWTDNNADVPNADHATTAGDADTVDGQQADDLGLSEAEVQEMTLIHNDGFAPRFGG